MSFPDLIALSPAGDGVRVECQRVLELKIRGCMDHALDDRQAVGRNSAQIGLGGQDIETPLFYFSRREILRCADPFHYDVGQFLMDRRAARYR